MSKVVNAYRASEYVPPPQTNSSFFNDFPGAEQSFLGDLKTDASSVASALKAFPYGSSLKLLGVAAVLYIAFKAVRKFVNIEEKLKQLLRSKTA